MAQRQSVLARLQSFSAGFASAPFDSVGYHEQLCQKQISGGSVRLSVCSADPHVISVEFVFINFLLVQYEVTLGLNIDFERMNR